jgi:signal transduction histidine kinase
MVSRSRIVPVVLAMLLLPLAPGISASAPQPAAGRPEQHGVMFLSADDFTRPYVRLLFESFNDVMAGVPNQPTVFFESLDALRFEDPRYVHDFREWLRRKYHGRRIDFIVPIGDETLGFLAEARGEPFPDAQVMFLEAGYVTVDTQRTLAHAGGMLLEDHFVDAVGVIKTILPATKHVALVFGSSAIEHARFSGFADKVRTAGLEPIEVAGKSLDDIIVAVTRLPADSVVMILAPTVDPKGFVIGPRQACERLSTVENAPVFTLAAHDFGCGVVGGLMRDWTIVGRVVGTEVLARLKQPSTSVVTLPIAKYTTLAFDHRQLERWHVPESRLPRGASIRFRELDLWRDRRGLVLGVLGVTMLQSLLIAGLVFEHRRRRRAEIESRRHLAGLAHMDRRAAMGELATSLAHELNQPLNAILQNAGVAQMMLAKTVTPPELGEMAEIISDIRKDDIRASEMIRRMRSLLQKHELESQPVDLNDVAADTIAIVRPDARARDVELELEITEDVGRILGDRVHLQQVLLNLLMNAIDAAGTRPAGRRSVRVSTSQSNGAVRLAVADTGAGISASQMAKIFEPFYTTKSEGSGMGMGLAIARSIVEAHGGVMSAENNAGGGATVWFSVPVASRRGKGNESSRDI